MRCKCGGFIHFAQNKKGEWGFFCRVCGYKDLGQIKEKEVSTMSNALDQKVKNLVKSSSKLDENYHKIKEWSKEQGLYLTRTFDLMFREFVEKHIKGEEDGDNSSNEDSNDVPKVSKD